MAASLFTRHPVLFEDEGLLIINKPAGVLSHPNHEGKSSGCAFEGFYDFKERCFASPAGPIWLIHRLDQETSGILLGAKNQKSADLCLAAFEKKEVEKYYFALVGRRPMPLHGKWRDTLTERHTGNSVRVSVKRSGPPNAILDYWVKDFFKKIDLSLLEIRLITGKTHQIRVQSAYHGSPVAGDRIYGNFGLNKALRQNLGLRRLFLHAWKLTLPHPSTGKLLEIRAPLPEELEVCLAQAASKR